MRRFPEEPLNTKIIFLDIDGVLNHELHYRTRDAIANPTVNEYLVAQLNASSVEYLNQIIEATGADVVISSTWGKAHSATEMQEVLEQVGFKGKVIGQTPYLTYKGYGGYPEPHLTVPRGCEIKAWLDTQYSHDELNSVNYLILDDDSDMLIWQSDAFIAVDPYCGLTPNNVYQGINILNKTRDELSMV